MIERAKYPTAFSGRNRNFRVKNSFTLLGTDPAKRILIEGPDGLFILRDRSFEKIEIPGESLVPQSPFFGPDGSLWLTVRKGTTDLPVCNGLVRLGSGLERFLQAVRGVCIEDMEAVGDVLYFMTGDAFGTLKENMPSLIPEIQGIPIQFGRALLLDSRGDLWIGTEAYDFLPGVGLARIHGADTILYRQGSPDFSTYTVTRLAEDAEGNVWVDSDSGIWIRLRDENRIPLGLSNIPARRNFHAGNRAIGRRYGGGFGFIQSDSKSGKTIYSAAGRAVKVDPLP